ncbi:BSD domain-containing protein 1 [Cyberlindnera fabianii]|uniref:BSD domain-containing protein 1 n=1 Tax=Cyberlindnera fabianii TaxID=36022 RepID=A0A1V2L0T6_CYBFA|nr:BSD domain-containing protein 1 [Cyberlindnera fabianii]
MDYVYETTGGKLSDSQETIQPAQSNVDDKTAEINRKTEESFEKLEDGISKTYSAIESRASTWGASLSSWMNTNLGDVITETRKQVEGLHLDQRLEETKTALSKNFEEIQKKVVTDENRAKSRDMFSLLSSKTNSYLDSLDKDLEQVETAAGRYATRFGQFLKDTISVASPDSDDEELIDEEVANVLFNVKDHKTGLKLSASRTEAQLHTLHTSPELYSTTESDPKFDNFKSTFSVESKTAKVSYDEFWTRYFYMKEKIFQQESTRKKLLGRAQEAVPTESEDLSWGDDDEDEEEEDPKNTSSTSTKGKTSAISNCVK